jgi:hypothetical protein
LTTILESIEKDEKEDDDATCGICRETFTSPVKLPCEHVFCNGCIRASLSNSDLCPLCKHNLAKEISQVMDEDAMKNAVGFGIISGAAAVGVTMLCIPLTGAISGDFGAVVRIVARVALVVALHGYFEVFFRLAIWHVAEEWRVGSGKATFWLRLLPVGLAAFVWALEDLKGLVPTVLAATYGGMFVLIGIGMKLGVFHG